MLLNVHIKMTRWLNLFILCIITKKSSDLFFWYLEGEKKEMKKNSESLINVKPSRIQRGDLSHENKQW